MSHTIFPSTVSVKRACRGGEFPTTDGIVIWWADLQIPNQTVTKGWSFDI